MGSSGKTGLQIGDPGFVARWSFARSRAIIRAYVGAQAGGEPQGRDPAGCAQTLAGEVDREHRPVALSDDSNTHMVYRGPVEYETIQ